MTAANRFDFGSEPVITNANETIEKTLTEQKTVEDFFFVIINPVSGRPVVRRDKEQTIVYRRASLDRNCCLLIERYRHRTEY